MSVFERLEVAPGLLRVGDRLVPYTEEDVVVSKPFEVERHGRWYVSVRLASGAFKSWGSATAPVKVKRPMEGAA
jgi:hypothetical protein